MELSGLHILMTYQCTFECDHCFVWGSPWQTGTLSLNQMREILRQAEGLGTVESIYFEGGEPTLYHPVLVRIVKEAHRMGFQVGIVSNAYWANDIEDALETLKPLAGLVGDLSVSSDLFHYSEKISQQSINAVQAARQLGIPVDTISIAQPTLASSEGQSGQLPAGESRVMYRGRAALKLVDQVEHQPWQQFTRCPHEDLVDPGRLHVDALGFLHICQGISIGNLFQRDLKDIIHDFNPHENAIVGALLDGGPAELVRRFKPAHLERYADACHLCYASRLALRERFPEILTPDQMYGKFA